LTYHGLTRLRREPTGSHWQNAATSRLFLPHIRPFSTLRNSGQRDSQEPNKHKVWWAILRSFPGVDRLNLP
ncbi:MAG: hypothetical protein KDA60_08205, partial [Planctomycetales bacterium]|nr:hypothetical protein [Planctomycetales bacterium]